MLPKTRRRVPHYSLWILALIIIITIVLACARPAYGCDPNLPDCQLDTPEQLAETGTAWAIWAFITFVSVVALGAALLTVSRTR